MADTDARAVAVAVGAFALFRAGWPAVQWIATRSLEDPYPRPEWYFWLGRVNPVNAYVRVTTGLAEVGYHPLITRPDESVTTVTASGEFAVVVLLAWAALAPLGGFLHWRERDLL